MANESLDLCLEETEQQLTEAYNYIDLLEREMVDLEKEITELKGASDIL
jgi:peptidoglycan hydrolase CwlO-like protein